MRAAREIVADVCCASSQIFRQMLLALAYKAAVADRDCLHITLKALHGFIPARSTPSLLVTRVP
jgi:hypothetical protein